MRARSIRSGWGVARIFLLNEICARISLQGSGCQVPSPARGGVQAHGSAWRAAFAPQVGKLQQVSVACRSQVLGRQVSASSVSKLSKTQVSASLGKFRQVSAKFRSDAPGVAPELPTNLRILSTILSTSTFAHKSQVSASLGKSRQISACFRSPSFSKFRRVVSASSVIRVATPKSATGL